MVGLAQMITNGVLRWWLAGLGLAKLGFSHHVPMP